MEEDCLIVETLEAVEISARNRHLSLVQMRTSVIHSEAELETEAERRTSSLLLYTVNAVSHLPLFILSGSYCT